MSQDRQTPEETLEQFGIPTDALQAFIANAIQTAPERRAFAESVTSALDRNPEAQAHAAALAAEDEKAAAAFAIGYAQGEQAREQRRNAVRGSGDGMNNGGRATFLPTGGPTPFDGTGPQQFDRSGPRAYDAPHVPGYDPTAAQAWHEFQRTGSRQAAATYAKQRLHSVISDEFLNE